MNRVYLSLFIFPPLFFRSWLKNIELVLNLVQKLVSNLQIVVVIEKTSDK